MEAKNDEWFSLSWGIYDFSDNKSYRQLNECPRFLLSEDKIENIKSNIAQKFNRLYLKSIFKTEIFIENEVGLRFPTHYSEKTFMPGENPKYDEWLMDYHSINCSFPEHRSLQYRLQEKKLFIRYTAKLIRHDMFSGINIFIPRGIKSLIRKIPRELADQLNISSDLDAIYEAQENTKLVYQGVRAFTEMINNERELKKELVSIGEVIEKSIKHTSYRKNITLINLNEVRKRVEPRLFGVAIDFLIRGGMQFNKSENKWVKVFMEDDHTLCIQDNGIGLSRSEFITHCKPYLSKANANKEPKGIELNIAVIIIERHNFSIAPEKLQKGTVFRINMNENQKIILVGNTDDKNKPKV